MKKLIDESGMSKQMLADKLGVQLQTIYRWISGERLPDIPMMLNVLKVLGADKNKLL